MAGSDEKPESSGSVFSNFVGDMKEKLHDSKLHDVKVALHHKRYAAVFCVPAAGS